MHEPDDGPTEALLDGRYRLGERLGRGGMADVYRAEDVLLGRQVAIKMIRLGVDGTAAPERARGEVNVLASLNHPSLVTLLDARLDSGAQEYIVMELVEGPTLSQRLRASPLPAREVARLAGEIAEALHVVHAAGIVHRDVKPSNVLLAPAHMPGREFRAKLADFGIAYLVDSTRVTTPGQVIGTAAYLAPEQVTGAEPAPPADVYALGLVLLEALTGRTAFPHAAGVASAIARLNAPPEIPAELGSEWTSLLERMTRIEPADRPTALEVAVESSRMATGSSPTLAMPAAPAPTAVLGATAAMTATRVLPASADASPTAPVTAVPATGRRRSGRRRGVLIGAAALGVAAIIGGGAWGLGALTDSPSPAVVEPALTDPSIAPSSPSTSTPAPVATPVTVGTEDDDASEQQAEDAEKAQKELEKEQERLDEEARKQAEDAAKQAEEQRKADEKAAEEAEQPAPPAQTPPAQTPPAQDPPPEQSPAPESTTPPTDS